MQNVVSIQWYTLDERLASKVRDPVWAFHRPPSLSQGTLWLIKIYSLMWSAGSPRKWTSECAQVSWFGYCIGDLYSLLGHKSGQIPCATLPEDSQDFDPMTVAYWKSAVCYIIVLPSSLPYSSGVSLESPPSRHDMFLTYWHVTWNWRVPRLQQHKHHIPRVYKQHSKVAQLEV